MEYLKDHKGFGGEKEIGFSGNSLDRTEINRNLIGKSFNGTEFLQNTPDAILDQRAKYPESIICREKK